MKYIFFLLIPFYSLLAQTATCKCCSENHAQFDFWIGNWEVSNEDGTLAGYSKIEKVQDNCVLRETWRSATSEYSGTSSNFYNIIAQKWEQLWLDNQGAYLKLEGEYTSNRMILEGESISEKDGDRNKNRITWNLNKDGSVTQHWEMQTNENDTWVTAFKGLYSRKTKK